MTAEVKKLIDAIHTYTAAVGEKKDAALKKIEILAKEVIGKSGTLDVGVNLYRGAHTPLEAAILSGSLEVFKRLLSLGANPFFKSQADRLSVIERLANAYFEPYLRDHTAPLFEWLLSDRDSPVFNWEKLGEHQALFELFKTANLIPETKYINELPLHVAIKHGRMDLVQHIVTIAGNMQRAGDLPRCGLLNAAIVPALEEKENALESLTYLLAQGASVQNRDLYNLPVIMQLISAHILYLANSKKVKEEKVIELVDLLLAHGASLAVTNPNNEHTPIMAAVASGYMILFDRLLDKADAKVLNHQARFMPGNLLFQLVDNDSRWHETTIISRLPQLKEKGMDFGIVRHHSDSTHPFNDETHVKSVLIRNISVLHYYVDQMFSPVGVSLHAIDRHLAIIQALTANGANPQAKATFILTKEHTDFKSRTTKKEVEQLDLTPAQYLRKMANSTRHHGYGARAVDMGQDEGVFLESISRRPRREKIRLHEEFHRFRNLERVLSGEQPMPYAGFPKRVKMKRQPSQQQQLSETKDLDPTLLEGQLIQARTKQQRAEWKMIKKTILEQVKQSSTLEDFLVNVEKFKKPLQLHYDITVNLKGELISSGSMMYRFFHYFNAQQFPNSWETLRKFGQDKFGVDINTQYESPAPGRR